MSEPWEDFGGTAVAEDTGPWTDFAPTEESKKSTKNDWMKVGGMGPTPAMGTPLIGSVPLASPKQYSEDQSTTQSAFPAINPAEVPSGEQISHVFPWVPKPVAIASSAISKGAAGLGQFLTSPKGAQEVVTAATPVLGIAQRLKWFYDMAKGAGESGGNLSAKIEKVVNNPSTATSDDWQGIADDAVNLGLMLYGAGKVGSETAGGLTGIRQPLGRVFESETTRLAKDKARIAKELASQLEQEAKAVPEAELPTRVPTGERRLGIGQVPPTEMQQPGVPELANAALEEAMQLVKIPGKEQEALGALRRAVEPPQITPEQTAVAERIQGGGEAPYGKVSYMREAEAPLPERTQVALEGEKIAKTDKPTAKDETVVSAAVRINGNVFTGSDHAAAIESYANSKGITIDEALKDIQKSADPNLDTGGFITSNGRYVSLEEASQISGKGPNVSHAAEIIPQTPTKGLITGRALEGWADEVLRGGATHAGPDVLAAYLVKGVALIERGVINFAEWSNRMLDEHGPEIKPHLESLYNAAKNTIARAPEEQGTLKSAREIVEQRLGQQEKPNAAAQPTTPTAAPAAPTQTGLEDVYKIFEPEKKEPVPVKKQASNVVEAIGTGLSSKFRPLNKLAEDIGKHYGVAVKNIAGLFEQLKGSSGKGEAQIYRFNRDVSSLVKGDERDFNAFMFLNRSLDRLRQDAVDIQRAQEGQEVGQLNRRAVAQYTIPQLESKLSLLQQKLGPEKLSKFQEAATRYQQYMDEALRLQLESGRMSPEVYDAIKKGNQFYAPFKVLKYLEESVRPEGTGAKIDTVADYTKAMKGIEDPNFKLGDMLSAARRSILVSRILADKANAMRLISEQAAIDKDQLFVKKVGPDSELLPGWDRVNVFENGKRVQYAVRSEVAQALQIFQGAGGGVISQVLRFMSIPFKAGATALNLPFQVSNLMADIPRQALVSRYGVKGVTDLVRYPLDIVHALYSSMAGDLLGKDNKLFLDFLDSGAAATTIQEHLTPDALKYRDPNVGSKTKRIALNILYSPAEFAAAIEQTSKILGVKRAMRQHGVTSGAELAKQFPNAITEIRRFSGSPDFGRQGKWVEQARLNLLYMFLNARIQGTVADLGRLAGRDGARTAATTWFRVGAAIGLPTAYLYFLNNSPQFKKDYDQRPQKEKDNYWLIPKDTFITNEDGQVLRDYWRIPKRESSKWIANMVEAGLTFAQNKDSKSLANFGQQMIEDISPVNIQGNTGQERMESVVSSLNPVIKAPIEIATRRDTYRHRDLIPDTMQKASPEQQYTDRTSEAFKKLANLMPDVAPEILRSPILLENMTRNLTAGLFTQFLTKKPIQGRTPMENAALLQRFQAIPYTENTEFTKRMTELERESADEYLNRHRVAQKALEDGKGKSLPEIIRSVGNDPKTMQHVVDLWVAKNNGATYDDKRLITLPPKQRAKYVSEMLSKLPADQKQQAIVDLAKKRVLTQDTFFEMSKLTK